MNQEISLTRLDRLISNTYLTENLQVVTIETSTDEEDSEDKSKSSDIV